MQFDPLPAYLDGWHIVAFSADVRPAKVLSCTAFGQEIIVFRDQEGQVRVLDAYCPHLGAHLGKGGQVVEGAVRCPFHGWRFNGQGECIEVPFAKKIPRKAKITCWPVQEVNGGVYVWYHHARIAPTYELPAHPAFDRETGSAPVRGMVTICAKVQDLGENTVDVLHFPAVHGGGIRTGVSSIPRVISIEEHGHEFHIQLETSSRILGWPRHSTLRFRLVGPSVNLTSVEAALKLSILTATTPIDEKTVRFYYMVRADRRIPLLQPVIEWFIGTRVRREIRQDIPIWENKIHVATPILSSADGPIMRYRKWMKQFHPEPAMTVMQPNLTMGHASSDVIDKY